MDMSYVEYCYADPYFYDLVRESTGMVNSRGRKFRISSEADWGSWSQGDSGGWHHVSPSEVELPDQGWKIHCSATVENAQQILYEISKYCGEHQIAFKYLPSSSDLIRQNVKYAPRGGSGKFVTIYPLTADETEQTLADINSTIGGMQGPYILSDLRYEEGPLYVRYGAYKLDFVRNELDELVPALRNSDGELEPDQRQPVFSPPDWVEIPPFIERMRNELGSADRPEDFPYVITEALHFSNGGGIYKAKSLDSDRLVVLKEARPHAGLSPDGQDAVSRLEREASYLEKFADLPQVVNLVGTFSSSGHHFLVEDHVEGLTLNKEMVSRSPIIRADETELDRAEYRDWALNVMKQIESTLDEFHKRGIIFGDLHPNNILIGPDDNPVFIDFEMAYGVNDPDVVPAGAPGYMAGDGRTGISADRYSLGCTQLALFLPLTVLIPLDPSKLPHLIEEAKQKFKLPDDYCASISQNIGHLPQDGSNCLVLKRRQVVDDWNMRDEDGVDDVLTGIAAGIWESAEFSRNDRIFPGDPKQFTENSVGVAHGASGNLLTHSGSETEREQTLDWIEWASTRLSSPSYGFFDGVAGIAYTLRRFGRFDTAGLLMNELLNIDFERLPSDLYGGLAGIGTFMIEEATNRPSKQINDALDAITSVLAERLDEPVDYIRDVNGVPTAATGKGGLMHGLTGQAIFWIRHYEYCGNEIDLDRAERALDVDLGLCVTVEDGSMQLNEGWRTLPYIGSGSVGVAMALLRLREHRKRTTHRDALVGIVQCARPEFAIQSNLLNGRAGFVYFLCQLYESDDSDLVTMEGIERHANHLRSHAVINRTGIHFPGEQIMRLSTDWATGSAGVFAALERYKELRFASDLTRKSIPFLGLESLQQNSIFPDGHHPTQFERR